MGMPFCIEDPAAVARLDAMTDAEIDALPIGVIGLARDGSVTLFNRHEAALTGLSADHVIGRCFFTHIAPCNEDANFRSLFLEGVDHGVLDVVLGWSFDVQRRAHEVLVRLALSRARAGAWLMIKRL